MAQSLCEPLLSRHQLGCAMSRLGGLPDPVFARVLGTFSWGLVAAGITEPGVAVALPSGAVMSTYGLSDPQLGVGAWIAKTDGGGGDWQWYRYGLERTDFGGEDADDADLDIQLCALPVGLSTRDAILAAAPFCGLEQAMFAVEECRHMRDYWTKTSGVNAWYWSVQLLAWQLRQQRGLDWPTLYRAALVATELELGMDEAKAMLLADIDAIETS
ncbi:hypothetical protein [Luteococcus japonicus]|uniref:hypothetical protein n=1 Tax=Luteococcus japonicus TaxID=33984 RepID=UPI0011CE3D48|nr:hypothetical protein [Luteococcus japonicus]